MTKTAPLTAADKDALISTAAAAGITITRTSKDFFLGEGIHRERVTPSQIKALIVEAQAEEQARREALEAAEQIRSQEVAGEAVASEVVAAPVAQEPAPEAAPAPAKVKVTYGPPCGGQIAHLPVATSEHARNPIVHLGALKPTQHKTKEDAAAAGKRAGAPGFLAFLAQDDQAERFWTVALADEQGLTLDGQHITLTLLEGAEADAARARIQGERIKAKSQWQAVAV